ncbi:hypothetical protein CRYUN_Cryun20dG0082500 [Craigia yunnanensis]
MGFFIFTRVNESIKEKPAKQTNSLLYFLLCSIDNAEGIESLRWEYQQRIRSYVEAGGPSNTIAVTPTAMESAIEVSKTSRATCKHGSQKIMKGEFHISFQPKGQGSKGLVWNHAKCFMELSLATEVEKLPRLENLSSSNQATVCKLVKKVPASKNDMEFTILVTKRKKDIGDDQKSKVTKLEEDLPTSRARSARNAKDLLDKEPKDSDLESKMEAQTKELADGMMFGALGKCPMYSSFLRFSGGMFHCHGYLSAWSNCSYSTCEPERLKGKWTKIHVIYKNLKVSIAGLPQESMEEWKGKIKGAGGIVHAKIKNDTNCFVVSGELDGHDAEIRKARRMKLPIAREDYLVDRFKRKKKLPFDLYKVEAIGEASSMVTVKVKGRSAVHEASGLQDSCHTLEDGGSIYNTTLNMSDLSTGVNSYYILQIIQEHKVSDCYVFRLWSQQVSQNKHTEADKQLSPPLLELMKMLFNVETYRQWPMFQANPLLSLTLSNYLDVKMLEALQDIEIASRLVGFDGDSDDSLDEKYKKLNSDITPLPRDEPTLELEEVFSLEREGEFDKFASYREKLNNRMLLWHVFQDLLDHYEIFSSAGSRLTNFLRILSQGLRIAPPEAPATGYMFGKGIYFADLVSKSTQYCYTDRKNPVCLMLVSEVALGEVYELTKAKYIEKLPKGKHSTKGIGKKEPKKSNFVKWKDEITVPCGEPVPSNVRASELMYNEYIVYNTGQVKMQFLLKVRFHRKR